MKMIATRVAYGEAIVAAGAENNKIVVMDADLSHATMTCGFASAYPDRFFNAGIAEANMAGMAAGLADMGYIPFISTFALFGAGRAYEIVRNSIAYPNMNVKLALSHAGITIGEDGGSHAAIEDLALMRVIPGMTILVPCDESQTRQAVKAAAEFVGPVYIRLARLPSRNLPEMPFEIGKGAVLRDGKDAVVFACGLMVGAALDAAEKLAICGLDIAVINLYSIKPIDGELVRQYAKKCGKIITIEEHSVIGGLGDAVVSELLHDGCGPVLQLGVQDKFGQSGKPEQVLEYYRLDPDSIAEDIEKFVK